MRDEVGEDLCSWEECLVWRATGSTARGGL
jgi:hypothetical protein